MLKQRTAEIYKLRNEGKTYKEIGELFNISPATVRDICFRAGRIIKLADSNNLFMIINQLEDEPIKIFNELKKKNISTFRDFFESKELDKRPNMKLLKERVAFALEKEAFSIGEQFGIIGFKEHYLQLCEDSKEYQRILDLCRAYHNIYKCGYKKALEEDNKAEMRSREQVIVFIEDILKIKRRD